MPVPLPGSDAALQALAAQARADLALLAYPDTPWVLPEDQAQGEDVLDVLVVGAGQSGLGICAALRAQGVTRVLALDRAAAGHEGVWDSFARMPELRTPKALNGLDLGLPALSVQRWYATRFGAAAWQAIERIPRTLWMDYLRWYRAALDLPVENACEVLDVRPDAQRAGLLAVDTRVAGQPRTRHARLVVLATGTDGAGAWRVPAFIAEALPRERCHHSADAIDFAAMAGTRVGVLGHGASAFDNAVAALRAGASSVDLCFRRARLPRGNPHRHIETAGLMTHYAQLSDATRWQVAQHFRTVDQPPPRGSFHQALAMPGFALHPGCGWEQVRWTEAGDIAITTPRGELRVDHVICATGQTVDMAARPEMRSLASAVARWGERYQPPADQASSGLAAYPYLGTHYEFTPRAAGQDWVGRVFAFNSASTVSQGPHSTSISGHKHALPRLVHGLTQRLFLDQQGQLLARLRADPALDLEIADDFEQTQAARSASRFLAAETSR